MTEKILFVCTANICRSPMAEALLRSRLAVSEVPVEVRSAGFLREGVPAERHAQSVMRRMGLDLSQHESAVVEKELATDPDLILTMAREHLSLLRERNPALLRHAFTLKEFVSLGELEGERFADESLRSYADRLGAVRNPSLVFAPGARMDVKDPIGRRRTAFARCASELNELVSQAAALLYPMADVLPGL